jgi:hypothetical protein
METSFVRPLAELTRSRASRMGIGHALAPFSRVELVTVALIGAASVAFFAAAFRLIDGSFINSYPYISSDGFDWIYEGDALVA